MGDMAFGCKDLEVWLRKEKNLITEEEWEPKRKKKRTETFMCLAI